jgi:hypothetical protein
MIQTLFAPAGANSARLFKGGSCGSLFFPALINATKFCCCFLFFSLAIFKKRNTIEEEGAG